MSLEKKYVHQVIKRMDPRNVREKTINGGQAYSFPCPFCSEAKTSSGKYKPTKRTAGIMPIKGCEGKYQFVCMRGGSVYCKDNKMDLKRFLWIHKPSLADSLNKEEKNANPTDFTFKPNFKEQN